VFVQPLLANALQIQIVFNWFEELAEAVPMN
jgi:hypothetical protein